MKYFSRFHRCFKFWPKLLNVVLCVCCIFGNSIFYSSWFYTSRFHTIHAIFVAPAYPSQPGVPPPYAPAATTAPPAMYPGQPGVAYPPAQQVRDSRYYCLYAFEVNPS